MKLWMSGEIEADVVDSYRQARNTVERVVNGLLEENLTRIDPEEWAFIAIIRAEDGPYYGEVVKKPSRGKALEFRLKIPHAEFLAGSQSQRIGLILRALSRSVTLMEKLGVPSETRTKLLEVLAKAERNLQVLN